MQFGDPQTTGNGAYSIYNSLISHISVRNTTLFNTGSQPGNPFYGVFEFCTISDIQANNCSAGIKIQGPSHDTVVSNVTMNMCGESTSGNSGFKLQGTAAQPIVRCTAVGISCSNQFGVGLNSEYTQDCTVVDYRGYNNSTGAGLPDIWIHGTNDTYLYLRSDNAGQSGIEVRVGTTGYRINTAKVTNPGQVAVATAKHGILIDGGTGSFGRVECYDTQTTPTMNHGASIAAGATGNVETWLTSGSTGTAIANSSATFQLGTLLTAGQAASTPLRAGLYYPTVPTNSITSNNAFGFGSLRVTPFYVPRSLTVSSLVAEVTAAGDAGSVIRMGIFSDDGTGYPGAIVFDATTTAGSSGVADATTVGVKEITFTAVALSPGNYWVSSVYQGGTSTQPTVRSLNSAPISFGTASLPGTGATASSYVQTGVTSTLPSTFTAAVAAGGAAFRTFVKVAS